MSKNEQLVRNALLREFKEQENYVQEKANRACRYYLPLGLLTVAGIVLLLAFIAWSGVLSLLMGAEQAANLLIAVMFCMAPTAGAIAIGSAREKDNFIELWEPQDQGDENAFQEFCERRLKE